MYFGRSVSLLCSRSWKINEATKRSLCTTQGGRRALGFEGAALGTDVTRYKSTVSVGRSFVGRIQITAAGDRSM